MAVELAVWAARSIRHKEWAPLQSWPAPRHSLLLQQPLPASQKTRSVTSSDEIQEVATTLFTSANYGLFLVAASCPDFDADCTRAGETKAREGAGLRLKTTHA